MASTLPASSVPSLRKCHLRFAFCSRSAPRRQNHDDGFAVWAAGTPDLDGQILGAGSRNVGAASENGSRRCERVDQHARAEAGEIVQTVAHGGDDAKISTAAAQCPKQLLFIGVVGDDDAPVGEHDLSG